MKGVISSKTESAEKSRTGWVFQPNGAGCGLRLKVKSKHKRNTHSLRECKTLRVFCVRLDADLIGIVSEWLVLGRKRK